MQPPLLKGNVMEKIDIVLSKLTFAQKLNLMEAIWDDISRDEKNLESPIWHREVLNDREKALAEGKAKFSDWKDAKNRIKRKTSCE